MIVILRQRSMSYMSIEAQVDSTIGKVVDDSGRDVIFIPVYPRVYIEEVTGIDSERRTVTAKFVLFITIEVPSQLMDPDVFTQTNIAFKESYNITEERKLRNYIREHLILEFGYNQTIFIPEHIVCENNPYLIKRVYQKFVEKGHNDEQKYVTYSIRGDIQCSASFNSMFFPYRKIEVFNHLCFMSQIYGDKILKYKVMRLKVEKNQDGIEEERNLQFLPYFGNKYFGDYVIDPESTLVTIGGNAKIMKKLLSPSGYGENLKGVKRHALNIARLGSLQANLQQKQQFEGSSKHILFKFDMNSLQISFILQNEVPIWILSFVTLMLYQAEPSIGGKYSNIILLLVSYISIISNFRINNIEQMGYSFFELKVIALTIVPLLLIISTSIDYYRDVNFANEGKVQLLNNPFGITSLCVVFLSFVVTVVLLMYIFLIKYWWVEDKKKSEHQKEELIDWMNMIDLEWVINSIDE